MTALLEFHDLDRRYQAGEQVVHALRGVSLSIEAGEMVAIMGVSGSGKSTLMNILGCLDKPSSGSYRVAGQETGAMSEDELARLRREHFGFIFQRYQLLGDLTALRNVEIPAIYAGMSAADRRARAQQLLERLGLGDRMTHRPNAWSGGQQQRVSIARALVNGGQVILADEPTGALDSSSSEEVLRILQELNQQGHTVIIVTHDAKVAAHAHRTIELSDGVVISDRQTQPRPAHAATLPPRVVATESWLMNTTSRIAEAAMMAIRSMTSHRLRTLLTTLGIIIGIASVVSVVALGAGSRTQILADIGSLGTNTIDVYAGTGFGDQRAASVRSLNTGDANALARLDYVDSVTPTVTTSVSLRKGNVDRITTVSGVGAQFFRVRGYTFATGQGFDENAVKLQAQDAVIDDNTRTALFADGTPALGQVILLGSVPVRIVGVTEKKKSPFGNSDSLNVWIPYTTAMARLTGLDSLRSITLRINDAAPNKAAEAGIKRLLTQRHGTVDFFLSNIASFRDTVEKTTLAISLLISSIAVISLVVGGIGVMNIMLVTVIERTQEIGIRMAVGARQSDILRQFLIEAVLVCLLGGMVGVALALGIATLFNHLVTTFQMPISGTSIAVAFVVSSAFGVVFGFLPARNAARLNPIDALAQV
ncbi:MAG: MacB family efflux pump subunit [Burkholderiaceae bacterium]